jgi:hypothetical protein
MTLRPEFSLGHSPYNAFLFAAVGEEQIGMPLTVLSALTRLGFDPWQEAARLSALPRETAARVFAVTIAMLPEGDWKVSESDAIAARLVNSLPGQSAQIIVPQKAGHTGGRKTTKGSVTALAWGALAAALLLLTLHLFSDNNLEFSPEAGVSMEGWNAGQAPLRAKFQRDEKIP